MRDKRLPLATRPAICGKARVPPRKCSRRFLVTFKLLGFPRAAVRQQPTQLPAMCLTALCFMMSLAK